MKALFGTTAAVVLATSLLAIPGQARPPQDGEATTEEAPRYARHRAGLVERWSEKLELSDAQVETLTAMQADVKATAKPLKEQMRALKLEMRELWSEEVIDADAVLAKQAELHDLQGAMAQVRLGFKLDALNVLDPEQKAQVIERMSKRAERGHGKRSRRGKRTRGHQAD